MKNRPLNDLEHISIPRKVCISKLEDCRHSAERKAEQISRKQLLLPQKALKEQFIEGISVADLSMRVLDVLK